MSRNPWSNPLRDRSGTETMFCFDCVTAPSRDGFLRCRDRYVDEVVSCNPTCDRSDDVTADETTAKN